MPIQSTRWEKEFEKQILQEWKQALAQNRFDEKSKQPVYSIDTPPPYVNTPVHVGHTATYCIMDFIARYKRMQGFNVLFPLGLDRNGLPIEMAAEKKFGKRFNEVSREEFLEMCRKVLEESSAESLDSFYKHGISFSSYEIGEKIGQVYQTDSPHYRSLTQDTFIELYNKNLIYEDTRINNYCPGCQTTIADAEIIYEDKPTYFNDVTFTVKETGEKIVIATTRPELVCTCGMVIFNPSDERYAHLDGKTAITPVFNKEVPIRPHPLAEKGKGTGLVMMCGGGDLTDNRFFRELGIKPLIAVDQTGKMNAHAGFLQGLRVKEARQKMIETLKEKGLLVTQREILHRTPICERSKHDIEFIEMNEYYLKQLEFKEQMKKIAEQTRFFADKSRQILLDWIESIAIDWPISRRRYYATEVPLWYCTQCKHVIVPPKGKYYRPWKEAPPTKTCPKCKSTLFRGDERVLDTWFDSSISPLYILQWSRDNAFFKKAFPCSLRPQGKEIVRTWLYYTLFKCFLLTGKRVFSDVWIHHHIVDENGRKFSKSAGTGIDPHEILEKFGCEPFRLWVALEGNLDQNDFRCSFERIEGSQKTLTKLWNTSRFISQFPKPTKKPVQLDPLDEWILSELNQLIQLARDGFDRYDFHNPTVELKHFLWETFSSHYLEMAKARAYNRENQFSKTEQKAAVWTLYESIRIVLELLYPVIPFISFKLQRELFETNTPRILSATFPKPVLLKTKPIFTTNELITLNQQIWQTKKEQGLALNAELATYKIPARFKSIEKALQSGHRIKQIRFE